MSIFRSYLEWQVWAFGAYEPHLSDLMADLVNAGDTVLDLGANFGAHAIHLAHAVGPFGRVIAIEAAQDLNERLAANVVLNQLTNVCT